MFKVLTVLTIEYYTCTISNALEINELLAEEHSNSTRVITFGLSATDTSFNPLETQTFEKMRPAIPVK